MTRGNPQHKNPWHLLTTPLGIHTLERTVLIYGKAFGPGDHCALPVIVQLLSHQMGFGGSGTNSGPAFLEQRDGVHRCHLPSFPVKACSHGAQVPLSELAKLSISGPVSEGTVRKGLLRSCFWKMSQDAPRFFANGSMGKNSLGQKQGKVIQDVQHSAGSFSEMQPKLPSNFASAF